MLGRRLPAYALAASPPEPGANPEHVEAEPSGSRLDAPSSQGAPARAREPMSTPAGEPARQRLGLAQVIERSVTADPRIRAAFADVLRARADRLRASAADNPELSVSQTLNPFPGHQFTAQRTGGPPQLDLQINYSLERLLFGVRRAEIRVADRQLEASLAAYAGVARERVLAAIEAYVGALEAAELEQLARANFTQLERLEAITARRVELGSVGRVELDRVRLAVVSGKRRMLSSRADAQNAKTRLRAQLGFEAQHPVEPAEGLEVVTREAPALAQLQARALAQRPELREQERRLAQAQQRQLRERRAALPKLRVGLGFTRQFQEQAIGAPDANSWGAALATTLPAFDRNQGGIAEAEADLFEAQANLYALRIEVGAEVEEAARSLEAAREILASFDAEALSSAERARATIEEAYGLGGRSLLELLDAQQAYRGVYGEYVGARADYLRALHRLNAVVGEEVVK